MQEINGYQIAVSDNTEDLMMRVRTMLELENGPWIPVGGVNQLANGKITQVMVRPGSKEAKEFRDDVTVEDMLNDSESSGTPFVSGSGNTGIVPGKS